LLPVNLRSWSRGALPSLLAKVVTRLVT
jgi:hypothetical protein